MTETTPGQAARTVWNDHRAGADPYPAGQTQEQTFDALWDRVAQAVLNQAFPGLKRERDEVKAAARDMAERSGAAEARLVLADAEIKRLTVQLARAEQEHDEIVGIHEQLKAARDEYRDSAILHVRERDEALAASDGRRTSLAEATARLVTANAELATCRERNTGIAAQSDQYRDQRYDYQIVIREMIAHWQYAGTTREDDELIAGWAQRAGLEQP